MSSNNNLSCIPFYKSKEEQDFRLWYAYGEKYPHYVPNDFLVPFSFPIPYNTSVQNVEFFRACCSEEQYLGTLGAFNEYFNLSFAQETTDFDDIMAINGLVVKGNTTDQTAIVAYYAYEYESLALEKGIYYMKITLNDGSEYYSDVFYVDSPEALARMVSIEWRNEEDILYDGGFIPYSEMNGVKFSNKIFLNTTIGMPEYQFTEDGEERNGKFFPIKQISEKVYKMSFIAPEYLCDVMRLIRMADYIKIVDGLGRTYNAEQFEMDVKWSQGGHYAEVSCSFQTDTIVKKIGKSYNF